MRAKPSQLYGWTVSAAVALFSVNAVIFTLELVLDPAWPAEFVHLVNGLVAALAVPACWKAAQDAGDSPAARRFWRQTTLGMIIMSVALLLRPLGMATDIAWLTLAFKGVQTVGAIVLTWSIARIPLGLRTRTGRVALGLDVATLMIASAVLVWHFFGTAARDAFMGGTAPNTGAIMGSALVGVLIAAKAALAGADVLPRGTLYLRAFAALLGGLGVAGSALLATRPDVDALVLLGPMASCAVALSAWYAIARGSGAAAERSRHRRYSLLPYIAITGVAALLVDVARERADDLMLVVAAAVVLTGLVVVRQLVSFRENDVLLTRLSEHEQQLRHDATHDALTGLANRTLLRERIDAALERDGDRRRLSVALIDLDDFKTVNDTLGHSVGDALLVTVADRMRANVRSTDLVARLGGDEFALLLEDLDHDSVERLIARIAEALAMPVQVENHLLVVRASFGVVDAADLTEAGDLMRRADIAMYEAKARGEGGLQRYRDGMETRGIERHRVATELRAAIDAGQLVLHYQPVVTLPEGRITGVEALVRWQHPTRGLLGPGEFIEIAEETGLIVPLGRWVLRTATMQAAAWVAEDGLETVAVNISARHLQSAGLAGEVAAVLRDSGLPARCLTIEVTESAAVGGGATQETLRELRALGVRLSLDDFGTGASTLSLLVNCPVDEIKLDRTFTPAPGPDAIAGAVLQLARAMGIEAVAEGVETPEQAAKLSSLGYEHAQGFHFARPMPPGELSDALRGGVAISAGRC